MHSGWYFALADPLPDNRRVQERFLFWLRAGGRELSASAMRSSWAIRWFARGSRATPVGHSQRTSVVLPTRRALDASGESKTAGARLSGNAKSNELCIDRARARQLREIVNRKECPFCGNYIFRLPAMPSYGVKAGVLPELRQKLGKAATVGRTSYDCFDQASCHCGRQLFVVRRNTLFNHLKRCLLSIAIECINFIDNSMTYLSESNRHRRLVW